MLCQSLVDFEQKNVIFMPFLHKNLSNFSNFLRKKQNGHHFPPKTPYCSSYFKIFGRYGHVATYSKAF